MVDSAAVHVRQSLVAGQPAAANGRSTNQRVADDRLIGMDSQAIHIPQMRHSASDATAGTGNRRAGTSAIGYGSCVNNRDGRDSDRR